MSSINRDNYELYFFDYHEGLLNNVQKSEVELFLMNYPELQMEFEAMGNAQLKPDHSVDPNWKNTLLKEEVTLSESEKLILDFIDGQDHSTSPQGLNEKEMSLYKLTVLKPEKLVYSGKQKLKSFNGGLPEFLEPALAKMNSNLKLSSEVGVIMPGKEGLKKSKAGGKLIPINFNWRAAAAAVALLAVLGNFFFGNDNRSPAMIAENVSPKVELKKSARKNNSTNDTLSLEENVVVKEQKNIEQSNTQENEQQYDRVAMNTMKVKSNFKPLATQYSFSKDLMLPSSDEFAAVNHKSDNEKEEAPSVQTYKRAEVLTLAQFAKQQLNKTLVNEKDPEEGLMLALLDRTVDKIDQRSDSNIELQIESENKRPKNFSLQIGRLEIKKK